MFVVHKVLKGETLSQIAREKHTTTSKIKKLNGISSTQEGERLLIEVLEGTPYTVKPFDSLSKIASRFNISEQSICEINGITEVFVGEVIIVTTNQNS
ncbi:MAG TPA: LysM peptidoglycan-binding domain-containing protein [Clostridia bacterium]|nr:LysM peptidoglycan-binding domain-containing protein [Clostridia bacterium]